MTCTIQLNEEDVKNLILDEIERRLGNVPFDKDRVTIEVKSKQNFKSEWETAALRATFTSSI